MYNPQQEVPVALVTEHYTYLGLLATSGKRLQDILNDSLTDYLNLRKVEIATSVTGETVLQELPTATILKENVLLGLLRQDAHEAPIRRQNYRVRRDFCEASITIKSIRIFGALHLPRASSQASAILARDLKNFFAVTDATVTLGPNGEELTPPVVMVNKKQIGLFYVGPIGQ